MTILVLGGGGLLGSHLCALHPELTIKTTRKTCNVFDTNQIDWYLKTQDVTAIINCAGITHHHAEFSDSLNMVEVNSLAPQNIRKICDKYNAKFIQVSTDCVFGRLSGSNDELSEAQPDDAYGKSKLAGEVTDFPHLTIRSSFVGFPDAKGRGLLHWLYSQESTAVGYSNVLWSGLTTLALSRYLVYFAQSRQSGLLHLTGQVISKERLLRTANTVFRWRKNILSGRSLRPSNRLLKSSKRSIRFPGTTNFGEALSEMYRIQSRLEIDL